MQNVMEYLESPKDSTKQFLEVMDLYNKFTGYKINTQESMAFLHANNAIERN